MMYIIDESLKDTFPMATPIEVVDHQTKVWYTGWYEVNYIIPWWLEAGVNHELKNDVLSRDMDQTVLGCEIEHLGYILDELEIDVVIVNSCLTHNGKKIKILMDANKYEENY